MRRRCGRARIVVGCGTWDVGCSIPRSVSRRGWDLFVCGGRRRCVGTLGVCRAVVTSRLGERALEGIDNDCDDPLAGLEFIGYHLQQRTGSRLPF
jgi:hypothetical protein